MNILCNVRANSELHSRAQCARVDGAASSASPVAACASPDAAAAEETYRASYGSIRVVPLTWGDDVPPFLHVIAPCCAQAPALHLTFLSRPFFLSQAAAHLVMASDCVFKESLVAPFLAVVKRLLHSRGTAIVANEFRSASVHSTFLKVHHAAAGASAARCTARV